MTIKMETINKENFALSSIIQLVKSAINLAVPELSFVVDQFANYQQTVQYNNIVDILNKHSQQIKLLMEAVINQDYIKSSRYANDVLLTVQKAKDELDSEKRAVYASYLSACCHKDNTSDKNKLIYLEILGRINYLDFYILKQLSKLFNGKNAIESCMSSFNLKHKENIDKLDIQIHLEYLLSLGLIERCDKEEVDTFYQRVRVEVPKGKLFKNYNYYQRTYLGDNLLKFINKSETNITNSH